MFKTTPRSVLLGGDLILKSVMRVYVDEEGRAHHYDDTLLAEHQGAYEHEDGSPIDRAPTGRQEDGHFHMIDAMLQHIMRLAAKNGFGDSFGRQHGIGVINSMILNHNLDRIRKEGKDTPNQLPPFGDPSWRIITAGDWFGEPKEGDPLLPHRTQGGDPHQIDTWDNETKTAGKMTVPRLVTVNLKKGHVTRHASADQGQYIDSTYNPFYAFVRPVMEHMDGIFREQLGLGPDQPGPLFDEKGDGSHMEDYEKPSVPLVATSSGQVINATAAELDHINETGRLSPDSAKRHEMHSDRMYQPAQGFEPQHRTSHGGVHYPTEMLLPNKRTGAPNVKSDRSPSIVKLLQDVVASKAGHMSPDDLQTANIILEKDKAERLEGRGHIRRLQGAPALTHLFRGAGDSRAASLGKSGFDDKIDKDGNYVGPSFLTRVAEKLGSSKQRALSLRPSIETKVPEGHRIGTEAVKLIRNMHALHAAVTNDMGGDAAAAAEAIKNHGIESLTPEQLSDVNDVRAITYLHSKYHQFENPIQGVTELQQNDATPLGGLNTPASPALERVSYPRYDPNPPLLQTSFDTYVPDINQIQKSFETLQVMSAMKDDSVMKYVKKGYSINSHNDIRSFSMAVGITTSDIQGIMATKGDWDIVAKQWNLSPTIVKATKVTFGGV